MGPVADVVPNVLHHRVFQKRFVVFAGAVLAVNHGTVERHHTAERVADRGRLLVTCNATHTVEGQAILEELGHGVVLFAYVMRVEVAQRGMT